MKKIVTVVIIAIFAATIILTAGTPRAKAEESAKVGYYGPDTYCNCVHTHVNQTSDCEAGLGMEAWYDFDLHYNTGGFAYLSGSWIFDAVVGYNRVSTWDVDGSPSCTYDINQYGYYAGTQFYGTNSPTYNAWGGLDYQNYYSASFSPDASSISGQSYAAFWLKTNHNNIQYVYAQPTNYTVLTAEAGPPHSY